MIGRAAGMGEGSGGCEGPVGEPIELPADIIVVEPTISKELMLTDGPELSDTEVVPGEFIVKVAAEENPAPSRQASAPTELMQLVGGEKVKPVFSRLSNTGSGLRSLGAGRIFSFKAGADVDEVVAALEEEFDVEWVEPVTRIRPFVTPNDPYWVYQWNMATLGAGTAWNTSRGQGVVVAIVDTGVSIGDDSPINLLPGHDFFDNDDDASDTHGHGTHVAGTVAQHTDNGVGVAGLAPEVDILPVRVLGPDGGTNETVAQGIVWAVEQGAQVINLSLGGGGHSQLVADAVEYAYNNGVTVVAASGNDGYNNYVCYPAHYESVIAVGATDLEGTRSYYSNAGSELDIAAPGGDVTADLDGDGYGDGILQETFNENGVWGYYFFQGTSMAT
ncbi:MAG: S8 family serine peptidase, partial [Proteobacteria bacterium]|nr:S8 family serine peptidase [Pseudomonadota bacterium]